MSLKPKKPWIDKPLKDVVTMRPLPNIGLIEVVENASDPIKQSRPPNWVKGELIRHPLTFPGAPPIGTFTRERSDWSAVSVTDVYVALLARMLPQGQTVELRVVMYAFYTESYDVWYRDVYRQTIKTTGKLVFPNVIVGTASGANFTEASKHLTKAQKVLVLFEMLLENESVGSLDAFFWGDPPPIIQPKIT